MATFVGILVKKAILAHCMDEIIGMRSTRAAMQTVKKSQGHLKRNVPTFIPPVQSNTSSGYSSCSDMKSRSTE